MAGDGTSCYVARSIDEMVVYISPAIRNLLIDPFSQVCPFGGYACRSKAKLKPYN